MFIGIRLKFDMCSNAFVESQLDTVIKENIHGPKKTLKNNNINYGLVIKSIISFTLKTVSTIIVIGSKLCKI